MYVCICRSITDKEIRKAAASGADSLYDLQDALGVAMGCGSCADMAESILDESRGPARGPRVYVPSPA